MGYDVEIARISSDIPNIKNIFPLKTKKVPLIGTIVAGVALLAADYIKYNPS